MKTFSQVLVQEQLISLAISLSLLFADDYGVC